MKAKPTTKITAAELAVIRKNELMDSVRHLSQDELCELYADAVLRYEFWERLSRSQSESLELVEMEASTLKNVMEGLIPGYENNRKAKLARKQGGHGKIQKNPVAADKAAAKAGALNLWQERQAGKHPKLRTVEQFAMEVMRRWPVLTSAKVICGWSAEWSKIVQKGGTPAC